MKHYSHTQALKKEAEEDIVMNDKDVIEAMDESLPEDFCGNWEPHEAHEMINSDANSLAEVAVCRGVAQPPLDEVSPPTSGGTSGVGITRIVNMGVGTDEKAPQSPSVYNLNYFSDVEREIRIAALNAAVKHTPGFVRKPDEVIREASEFEKYIKKGYSDGS